MNRWFRNVICMRRRPFGWRSWQGSRCCSTFRWLALPSSTWWCFSLLMTAEPRVGTVCDSDSKAHLVALKTFTQGQSLDCFVMCFLICVAIHFDTSTGSVERRRMRRGRRDDRTPHWIPPPRTPVVAGHPRPPWRHLRPSVTSDRTRALRSDRLLPDANALSLFLLAFLSVIVVTFVWIGMFTAGYDHAYFISSNFLPVFQTIMSKVSIHANVCYLCQCWMISFLCGSMNFV